MSAMPEREMWWLNPEEDGTMIVVDHPVASFPLAIRLVPESRLREVEAERDALVPLARLGLEAYKAGSQSLNYDKYPAGRFVRDAVQFGVIRLSEPIPWPNRANESPFPFPIDTDATDAARAILDRRDREAK